MFTAILKQMIRKPRKYALAAVLLGFSAFLLGTGLTLSLLSAKTTAEMEAHFTTVGTVEQTPDGYDESFSPELQAELGVEGRPLFDRIVSPGELGDMPGLKEPLIKQQVLFGSLFRQNGETVYAQESAQENKYKHVVYRFRVPSEERIAAEGEEIFLRTTEGFKSGFMIEILEVLHGLQYDDYAKELAGSLRLVSAPGAEKSPALEMGKEYVGMFSFYNFSGMEFYMAEDVNRVVSASPDEVVYEPVGDMGIVPAEDTAVVEEILAFCKTFHANTFVLTPIRSMEEFLAFGSKDITIVEGRNITPEEFASGAKVCVVPETMVRDPDLSDYKNNTSVGDKIDITFVAGATGTRPEWYDTGWGITVQPVLFDSAPVTETYEIVGVYPAKSAEEGSSMAAEQILVPHIGAPAVPLIESNKLFMGNNSFVIENGTAHQVVAWAEKHPNLLLQFEDGGYTLAAAGIGAVSRVGLVMLVSGLVAFLAVGAFFIRLEVSGSKRETGIRLALGEKKGRALCCLAVPLVLAVLVGTTAGVIGGQSVSANLGQSTYQAAQQVSYSRKYSDKTMTGERAEFTPDFSGDPLWSLGIWAGANLLCAAGVLFSGARVLRIQPHRLLGKEGTGE